jgi:flagellar protein FliT
MNTPDIITLYREMSARTGDMLAAARAADWELLAVLEAGRSAHEQILRNEAQRQVLSGPQREQAIELIQKILDDDLKSLELTKTRMAQLSSLTNSAVTERKLSDAYT